MQRRRFGPLSTVVPVIGQGTWHLEHQDRQRCVAALRRGLDEGMSHIDTAELYGDGTVEEIVAEAIAGRRDEVFLVSKVLPGGATREGTIRAGEQSLRRLGTDRLDVYLLHWPGSHPLEETFAGMEALRAAGKIRAYGVSNFDVEDLEAAEAIVGPGKLVCNQVLYHLGERAIEHRVLPWCRDHGLAVVAYSPFGSGRFPAARSAGGKALAAIAARRGVSPRQVALRFLVRDSDAFAIPKAGDPAHAADNAAAGRWELTPEEVATLDAAFPARAAASLPML
jgi:diketogulonate reductase-like aldo/keto reductase